MTSTNGDGGSNQQNGAVANVLYVYRRNAKAVKTFLEQEKLLDQQFRMTLSTASSDNVAECIAVPITPDCLSREELPWAPMVVGRGTQWCPYSSVVLGNHHPKRQLAHTNKVSSLLKTPAQQALFTALVQCSSRVLTAQEEVELVNRIQSLTVTTCPKKLQVWGDDRTLVIPPRAFQEDDAAFLSLLSLVSDAPFQEWSESFWKEFAAAVGGSSRRRVIRRGEINPDSSIRESGTTLLWPPCKYNADEESSSSTTTDPSASPGWITITEQGISQSFDFTKVMFSRGNITEKIRFGTLVKEGDVVLDMYAGIGYYTLPALIKGKAAHVVACEWNEHAANALQYNLTTNGVVDINERATVLVGDCRILAKEHHLVNKFDRVSLGLLPSSEGGWQTALRALRDMTGGWLHVHGNVPDLELTKWKQWVCQRLLDHVISDGNVNRKDWVVVCTHVERVKSYAPHIHHYVADVLVGPPCRIRLEPVDLHGQRAGFLDKNNEFIANSVNVVPPSCALSPDGVLHQDWMMDFNDHNEPYE